MQANRSNQAYYTRRHDYTPLTPEELWRRKISLYQDLGSSDFAEDLEGRIGELNTEEAEKPFAEALAKVSDPQLRNELDSAVGIIAQAYRVRGFIAGCLSQETGAYYNY